jgi:hypothetical protein
MGLVEFCKLVERVIADDIRVEDEEGLVVLSKDTLSEFEGASSAQRFCLNGEVDLDIVNFLVLHNGQLWHLTFVLTGSVPSSGRRSSCRACSLQRARYW